MLNPEILAVEPNPIHPKLGDMIKVEPIQTVNAINKEIDSIYTAMEL